MRSSEGNFQARRRDDGIVTAAAGSHPPGAFAGHWQLSPSLQLDPVHPASQRQPAAKARPWKPGEDKGMSLAWESWGPASTPPSCGLPTHSLCTAHAGCSWRGHSPARCRHHPARSGRCIHNGHPHRSHGHCSWVAGSGVHAHTLQWKRGGDSATCCPGCGGFTVRRGLGLGAGPCCSL